jgi:hypothetical protein
MEKKLKLRIQLHRHVPIFDQPKSYSCNYILDNTNTQTKQQVNNTK